LTERCEGYPHSQWEVFHARAVDDRIRFFHWAFQNLCAYKVGSAEGYWECIKDGITSKKIEVRFGGIEPTFIASIVNIRIMAVIADRLVDISSNP